MAFLEFHLSGHQTRRTCSIGPSPSSSHDVRLQTAHTPRGRVARGAAPTRVVFAHRHRGSATETGLAKERAREAAKRRRQDTRVAARAKIFRLDFWRQLTWKSLEKPRQSWVDCGAGKKRCHLKRCVGRCHHGPPLLNKAPIS